MSAVAEFERQSHDAKRYVERSLARADSLPALFKCVVLPPWLLDFQVPAQKCRHVEVLTVNDRWLAFFEPATADWLELQSFLLHVFRFCRRGGGCCFRNSRRCR